MHAHPGIPGTEPYARGRGGDPGRGPGAAATTRVDREETEPGVPAIILFDREQTVRGRVVKRHGVYAVLDARGHVILRTRRREDMLAALAK